MNPTDYGDFSSSVTIKFTFVVVCEMFQKLLDGLI